MDHFTHNIIRTAIYSPVVSMAHYFMHRKRITGNDSDPGSQPFCLGVLSGKQFSLSISRPER